MTDTNRRKNSYKQENNSTRKLSEEVIPKYSPTLQKETMLECGAIMNEVRRFSDKAPDDDYPVRMKSWTIRNAHGEDAYFTMNFVMPVIQYIPPAFKPIHFRFRFTQLDMVEYTPCYLMNLNHVALTKITNSNYNTYSIGRGIFNKYAYEGRRLMNLSSSNILGLGSAKESVQTSKQDVIEKCFEFCYWHLPTPSNTSCVHNLIYHKNDRIVNGGVLQLHKTLVKIIKIEGRPKSMKILPHGEIVKYRSVDVTMLIDDSHKIFSKTCSLFVTENVLNSLKDGDIINAIIIKQNFQSKFTLVIGKIGDVMKIGNLKPLLGIILWKYLQDVKENSSITKVEHIKKITEKAIQILENNSDEDGFFHPMFAWDGKLSKNIEKSISDLFPLYVIKKDVVHQMSPTLLSFILAFMPKIISDEKFINSIVDLFDLLNINSNEWDENSHKLLDSKDPLTTPSLTTFFNNLPKIVNRMTYSRILSKHYSSHKS